MKKYIIVLSMSIFVGLICISCEKENPDTIPPAEVTEFNAASGHEEVTLTWVKPSDIDLSGYHISYVPGGSVISVENSIEEYTVNQLFNGTEYTFTIQSEDETGNVSSGVSIMATPEDTTSNSGNSPIPYIGDISFGSQEDINNWDSKYSYILGTAVIYGADITDLTPLSNLDSITGKLEITFNPELLSLSGLDSIRSVGITLYIRENPKLEDFSGLGNIEIVGKDIALLDLEGLTNLDFFSNLKTTGTLYIGIEGWKEEPKDRGNKNLLDFCGLYPMLSAGGLSSEYHVQNNAFNPTIEEILSSCN